MAGLGEEPEHWTDCWYCGRPWPYGAGYWAIVTIDNVSRGACPIHSTEAFRRDYMQRGRTLTHTALGRPALRGERPSRPAPSVRSRVRGGCCTRRIPQQHRHTEPVLRSDVAPDTAKRPIRQGHRPHWSRAGGTWG